MPLVYTLWQRNAKKNQHLVVKIQQAAANKIICSSTWFFFFKEPADKKKGKKNWKSYYRCTWYTYHIKDALDNHEHTGHGAGCKRPRQRGTDALFTCVLLRSCRDVRRPRHLPNAKTTAIFQPDPDGTRKNKSRISEIPRPGRYRTNIK